MSLPPCPFSKLHPSQLNRDHTFFMSLAFNQAIEAWAADEVPIGAVIVHRGEVIASAHNQTITTNDPTAHAEILAISQAANAIGDWRLNDCVLYVTKEPCPMCSGATIMSRISQVYYATPDPKMGCLGGATELQSLPKLNHLVTAEQGPLKEESTQLLQAFFELKRNA